MSEPVTERRDFPPAIRANPASGVRRRHVSAGEIADIRAQLPADLQAILG